MPDRMTVDILLAVYNGTHLLPEQIRSLQAQSHGDWRLWVRDDGSTDDTIRVVQESAAADPRIRLVCGGGARLGASRGLGWLMDQLPESARYIMFCDQDDIWLPNKIELTLSAMQATEVEAGPNIPVLVHTDLVVVDADLDVIEDSFWEYSAIHPERLTLGRLLVQNTVTGCAAMINRPLRDLASPVPAEAVMHDWWMALVAFCFGRIVSLRTATILYRQHGRNAVGAHRLERGAVALFRKTLESYQNTTRLRSAIKGTADQAGAFLERFRSRLTPEDQQLLERYAEIPRCGFWRRKLRVIRLRTLSEHGLARNIGLVLRA